MVVPLGLLNTTPTVPYVFGSPARQGLIAQYLANYPGANSQFLSAEQPPAFGVTQPRGDYVAVTPYVPEPVQQPVYREPRYRRSTPDEAPMDAPSFSMDIADANPGTYGYSPLSDATSQAAMDAYSMGLDMQQTAYSPADLASVAGQQAAANYKAAQPSMPSFSEMTSQPVGQTVNQALDAFTKPTAMLGTMLGMATGIPGTGFALDKMAEMNLSNLAYDRAMEMQGVPGYSTGQIGGQAFSISPGPFGFGQVLSGVVPDYFDIDMAQAMQSVQEGIDPNTGDTLSGFTPGVGGYNSAGNFVDSYGNVSVYGTMGNLETLANQQFDGKVAAARNALSLARQGIKPLIFKNRSIFDYEPDPDGGFDGFGGFGSGGVDEGAFSDAVTTATFDAFGAAFDDAYGGYSGLGSGFGASFDDGYDGFGDAGDADDGAGLGGEDV